MKFADEMTLGEARTWLLSKIEEEGAHCPVCTQFVKVYRWSLYATAAEALILFYRLGGIDTFVHSRMLKAYGHQGQGDAARLRFWGLVEEEPERREDGGRSGYWRVTSLGRRFVLGWAVIHQYAYVFDSKCLLLAGPPVWIRDALGVRFNYGDIMAGIWS